MEEIGDGFRLSPQQEHLWLLRHTSGSSPYRTLCAVLVEGHLDKEILRAALQSVVDRHEILRTSFHYVPELEIAVQSIAGSAALLIDEQTLRDWDRPQQEAAIEALFHDARRQPFDFEHGPLLHLSIVTLSPDSSMLLIRLPALCADMTSIKNLVREIGRAYTAHLHREELSDETLQYADVAEWQHELLQAEDREIERAYWRKKDFSSLSTLQLPFERQHSGPQEDRPEFQPQVLAVSIPTAPLEAAARACGTSPAVFLLTCWQILLWRLVEQPDIVVGTAYDGRRHGELMDAIGLFAKYIPLHCRLATDSRLDILLRQVDEHMRDIYDHQDYFSWELANLNGHSAGMRFAPFCFDFEPQSASYSTDGISFSVFNQYSCIDRFKIKLSCLQRDDSLSAEFHYDSALFDTEDIQRLAWQFQALAGHAVDNLRAPIGELKIVSDIERQQLLFGFNDTTTDYPRDRRIHELFEEQAEHAPDAIAIVFDGPPATDHHTDTIYRVPTNDQRPTTSGSPLHPFTPSPLHPFTQQLTYAELNRRANQLAHYLGSLGVGPDVRVGLCVERSPDMIVAILGMLKAGGTYVPLDPDYPQERLAFMLEDSQAAVILTQARLADDLPSVWAPIIRLDADRDLIARESAQNPCVAALQDNLAYVIYTSGSTGVPKGVLITHRNLLHSTWARLAYYREPITSFLLLASFAFDSSVAGIFWTLCQSGTLVLPPDGLQRDVSRIASMIDQHVVSHITSLPSLYAGLLAQPLPRRLASLQAVIVAGEACPGELVERHHELLPQTSLFNEYGPTEGTVWSSVYCCVPHMQGAQVSIGRPIANMQIYLLDDRLELVPIGAPGELYIGGAGLARGYLHRPDLTAERFIPNPFAGVLGDGCWVSGAESSNTQHPTPNTRLYRTGDRARYRANGEIVFLGRADQQVKVRGYRVELEEIEAALRQHAAVHEAVVVAREEGAGDVRLVAYVVQGSGVRGQGSEDSAHEILISDPRSLTPDLRGFLQVRLPGFMVPSAFVVLDALPLTPNGKVDRKALPAPETALLGQDGGFVAPRTPFEEILAAIWADVLGLERVGARDNFFEVGGHSLLAAQIVARAGESLRVELSIRDLFEAPTLEGFAARLAEAQRDTAGLHVPPLLPAARDTAPPLSFTQQRLWFIDQLEPGSPVYNIPIAVRLNGPLAVPALHQSLGAIIDRHEVLRTTFAAVDGLPVQVIGRSCAASLSLLDLRALPADEREAVAARLATAEARRPFDLARGPLLRAVLLRLGDAEHILLLTMHHIVSDAWSMDVFIREVTALYVAFSAGYPSPLPELPIQYADYAVWQRAWLQGPGVGGQGSDAPEEQRTKNKEQNREHHDRGSDGRGVFHTPGQESAAGEGQTQNSKLKTQNSPLEAQLAYWRAQLADLPTLELPTDCPRPPVATFQGDQRHFVLPPALPAELLALSRAEGVTLFMTLLAAFQALLSRYSGQDDLAVGTPVANRNRTAIEGLIGCFVNTLVLRADLSGAPTFRELLRHVRAVCLDAYAHQDLPFEQVVEALQPARDPGRHPLFQVLFALQNTPVAFVELPGLMLRPLNVEHLATQFDLSLAIDETGADLAGTLEYRTDLFDAPTSERMLAHFQTLLAQLVAQPGRRLADVSLLAEAERQQLLVEWNATAATYPQAQCLHQIFEAQAQRTPDAVAVVFDRGQGSGVRGQGTGDKQTSRQADKACPEWERGETRSASVLSPQSLTYTELNERANRLAHHLRALGVGPEVSVGLCVERSMELAVGLLGVLKAGGAALLLDPADPQERLAFMLEDSQAAVLITTIGVTDKETRRQGDKETESAHDVTLSPLHLVTPSPLHLVTLSSSWPAIALCAADDPVGALDPDNLAVTIYTSGSTGRPKGVQLSHQALIHYTHAVVPQFGMCASDRVLQFASLGFDVVLEELFPTWASGATVVLHDVGLLEPGVEFERLIDCERVTAVELPAAYWQAWVDHLAKSENAIPPSLHLVVLGCEQPTSDRLAAWRRFGVALTYVFGLTETAITSTLYHLAPGGAPATPWPSLPIGRPIANTQTYVLDAHMQPVPIGVPGELYIGGAGLARGYLGRPDLTAERFIPNPFAKVLGVGCWVTGAESSNTQHPSPNTRLYKTGDRARYRRDGDLEFLGRSDQQVKLRGFRVELGEIEAALAQHPDVREAVVVAREDAPGERRLVAYIIPKIEDRGLKIEDSGSDAPDPLSSILYPLSSELRGFLQVRLPDYMIPAAFVVLDALPLTPSGKIDRRALPVPDSAAGADAAFAAPRTPVEALLAELWADVLGLAQVGAHDDFFALGGHSLLAVRLIARVRTAFAVELPLRSVFSAPTVAALASEIAAARRDPALARRPPLRPVPRDQPLPLSFAQQRLWFLDQLQPDSPLYNVPVAVRLSGALALAALQGSLTEVVRRHEALRTTFTTDSGRPVQVIEPATPVALLLLDLQGLPAREDVARQLAMAEAQQPFDLARGPLLRVTLLRLAAQEHIALLTAHHIISDAWSTEVLVREITTLCSAFAAGQPSPLPELPVQYADYAVWQRAWLQGSTEGGAETRRRLETPSPTPNTHPPSPIPHPPSPIEVQLAYWKEQLAGLSVLALPTDYPRTLAPTFRGASQSTAFPAALRDALLALSRRAGVTLFMTLLAAFQALLARYSGQDDSVVGTPVANRSQGETADLIGFFLNMLVLRTDLSGDPTFRELLGRVREVCLDAYAHQEIPFEQVVDDLQPARDVSRHPLFQVVFVLEHTLPPVALPGVTVRRFTVPTTTAKVDLTLSLVEGASGLEGTLEYSADLFEAATIARMLDHLRRLLEGIAAAPDCRLAALPLLSEAEREQLLVEWNATWTEFRSQESGVRSETACIQDLFAAQAARRPDAIALVFDRPPTTDHRPPTTDHDSPLHPFAPSPLHPFSEYLSYRELNERANCLARHLRALGVGPEARVAVCVERSPELVVALLGILKAGGAYVPLDPNYPQQRLAFMLEDSQAAVLITAAGEGDRETRPYKNQEGRDEDELKTQNSKLKTQDYTPSPPHLVTLSELWPKLAHVDAANLTLTLTPDQLAYVIYTSGSTGRPKGVLLAHRGLYNLAQAQIDSWDVRPSDRVLQFASPSFDASLSEICMALLAGATLCLAPAETLLPGSTLMQLLREQAISVVTLPPPVLLALLPEPLPALRTLIVAGEACPPDLLARWAAGRRLFNGYGPTEVTIGCCTAACIDDGRAVPIGRPFANTQVYLLDDQQQPVPIGAVGELYVGGLGLARGYHNRPDLTAERFVPNPFQGMGDGGWGMEDATPIPHPSPPPALRLSPILRLYRTGDLARYRADGQIEFLGRIDEQVKLRGYRVELGEIEAALRQHSALREAAVLLREDAPGERRLVAYVVPKIEDRGLKIEDSGSDAPALLSSIFYPLSPEVRAFLQQRLPAYMVPAVFVVLEALPLTPSGKLDRRALPVPERTLRVLDTPFVAPRTPVEATLARIWADVLRLAQVGVHNNFFALGGDSILSIQIVARANQAGLRLTARQMFQHQTIAELATVAGTAPAASIEQGPVEGPLPLTPIQRWFFEQELPEPQHFNQALLLEAHRPLDPVLLQRALWHILAHHDALRLRFTRADEGWRQINAGVAAQPGVTCIDLSGLPAGELGPAIAAQAARAQASLDLARGPLVRLVRFACGPGRPERLLLVVHHLAVDGVSWRVLLEDLQTLYAQLQRGKPAVLPPKTTSFQQWAARLEVYAQSDALQEELPYWLAVARRASGRLPLDDPQGANTVASARTLTLALDADRTAALLHELPAAHQLQINDVLLTALAQTYAEWTGARSLLLDLEGHGREELFANVDLSRTVGWLTILYPVLLDLPETRGPGADLRAVKEQLRAVPQRGIGYGVLRYLSRAEGAAPLRTAPAAEISFNNLGQIDQALPVEGLFGPARESSGPVQSPQGRRAHLLEVAGLVAAGRLRIEWTYGEQFHRRATIERLAQMYLSALQSLIDHCLSASAAGYSASDFARYRWSQADLDSIVAAISKARGQARPDGERDASIESFYPLSPMQQGMLFHTLYEPQSDVYFEQLACMLRGDLDRAALRHAWERVADRHVIFRTAFLWEGLKAPVQVVYRRVEPSWSDEDWRGLAADEQSARLDAFLAADRRQGFALDQAPLIRLALFRVADEVYHFVWSHHHLLIDGWSGPLVFDEVLTIYEALATRREPLLDRPRPYRDYIDWLQEQDLAGAEMFWRRTLAGFATPPLAIDRPAGLDGGPASFASQEIVLGEPATAALQALARTHGLTLNTLVQGAWALLLSRYSGADDVVFGTTVAGRPAELVGVERMVGVFINTLPVRVRVPPEARVLPWLRQLQAEQAELRQYEYSPLVQVQGWSDVPRGQPLFESIVVFQNYPITAAVAAREGRSSLRVEQVRSVEYDNYPLSLLAAPGRTLSLQLTCDRRRFDQAVIARMLGQLQTLLEGLGAGLDQPLAGLALLPAAERQQLLVEWNATATAYPHDQCLHQLFEAQVERTPDAVAVVFDRGQGSGVWGQESARQGDKETRPAPSGNEGRQGVRSQESGVRSQESDVGERQTQNSKLKTQNYSPNTQHPTPNTQHLTYRELNERANRLAHHLRALGVGPEVRVGLCMERSLEWAIGLLGVLKTGGAYVPLDPADPAERLAFMLADAQAAVLITIIGAPDTETRRHGDTETEYAHDVTVSPPHPVTLSPLHLVTLSESWPTIAASPPGNPACRAKPENLAYAIYTSGSTGAPKGVLVSHQALVNYTMAVAQRFELRPGDRMLQFAALSFDVVVEELFPAWTCGATLVLHGAGMPVSTDEFSRLLAREQVTAMELPAAYWHAWVDDLARRDRAVPAALRLVILGCERPSSGRLAAWRRFGIPLIYVFGLTETAITSTLYVVPADAPREDSMVELPIGCPIANTQTYVLDARMRPLPIGVPGELYIGGDGLARGYLGRPDLTADRFIPNPFAGVTGDGCWVLEDSLPVTQHPTPNTRLYRTGDRARYRADGQIEFLGRVDQQVKVRGFRVEPGEVEAALARHAAVREAVVVAREERAGDVRLVAYVVPKIEDRGLKIEDSGSDAHEPLSSILYPLSSELRHFLKDKLPDYMVPTAFVMLETLPLLSNGKVDRRALPPPDPGWTAALETETFVAPRTPVEQILAAIWADVLRQERVGIRDNFFTLGGHSLLAIQIIARTRDAFQVELPLRSLFEAPTLADLAARIAAARQDAPGPQAPLRPVPRDRALPLSFAQQRLWFLDQLRPGSSAYTIPAAVDLMGTLDVAALARSLGMIVRRHETLRTTFTAVGGQPVQLIAPAAPLVLPLLDLRALPAEERLAVARRMAMEDARLPFDLARGPLLRATLLRLDGDEHVVLLTMHHIVSDAWSIQVLVREIATLYAASTVGQSAQLPNLPIQYADYAVWQRSWLQGSGVRGQETGDKETPYGGVARRQGLPRVATRGDKETRLVAETQSSVLSPQSSVLQSPLQAQLAYWKAQLADLPELELPTDYPRSPDRSSRGASCDISLPAALGAELIALSRREGVTLFMTVLAAFQLLLARYSGQDDIAVGTPIAGRTHSATEGLIGFFLNTLVLRTDLSSDPTFCELLYRVREVCLGAYAHQDVPFEYLVETLNPERDLGRNPLFDVLVNFDNVPPTDMQLPGLTLRGLDAAEPESKFALTLYVQERGGALGLQMVYLRALFAPEHIACILSQLQHLLEQIVAAPTQPIGAYSLVTPESRALLPDPRVELPEPVYDYVPHIVAAWAARAPDQTAVCQGDLAWTYRELAGRADMIARALLAHGLARGEVVALCGPRSFGLIAGMLGVLASGAVLLPIDPGLPLERRRVMVREAGVTRLIVVDGANADDAWPDAPAAIAVDSATGRVTAPQGGDTEAPLPNLAPDDPAYLFFTSGTTGVPRGVLGCHKGLNHFLAWQRTAFAAEPHDRAAQLTGLSFDVVLRDVFLPLTSGATVCLPPPGVEPGSDRVLPWLDRERVTLLHTVPALLQGWLAQVPAQATLPALRWTFCAGEPLPAALAQRWRAATPAGAIANLYGPTETTLAKCCYVLPEDLPDGVQPVGRSLPETQALVLNGDRLCGIGEPGEIVIRTPFRTLGYINAPDEQRFHPNPFRADAGDLIYRTGDRGRYRLDGELDILGRLDQQVKIRGLRVEPDEVTALLLQHPAVREAVVVAREDALGQPCLVAYVVQGSGVRGQGSEARSQESGVRSREPDAGQRTTQNSKLKTQNFSPNPQSPIPDLRAFLQERLPAAMVPATFVALEALPLTANGKVDRRALPAPDLGGRTTMDTSVAPRTPVEEILAQIWADVLDVERVGVHDNFFELGGHSLLTTQIIARVRETFQVELPLRTLFEAPSVAALAECIVVARRDERDSPPAPRPVARDRTLPLSFAQQRLWFIDQLEPGNWAYTIPLAMRLVGPLDAAALRGSLSAIMRRHEILRTTFPALGGQPAQAIAPARTVPLPLLDLRRLPADMREAVALRLATAEVRRPFDLARGPLLRVVLLRLDDLEHIALLTTHHIVADGWSMDVLVRELAELYAARIAHQPDRLPDLPIQYADYAVWQRAWLLGTGDRGQETGDKETRPAPSGNEGRQGDKETRLVAETQSSVLSPQSSVLQSPLQAQLAYWRRQLANLPALELPTDYPRPPLATFRGERQDWAIPAALRTQLRALGRAQGVTLFMALLAALQALLSRYSGQDDIAVGTPIANRAYAETEGLIGCFVNTLVLRGDLSGAPTFHALLRRVRAVCLDAYAHQDLPFEQLVEALAPARDLSRHPLFQIMLTLEHAPASAPDLPGLTLRPLEIAQGTTEFDLNLTLVESGAELQGAVTYRTDLFERATIARMLGHFQTLLAGLVTRPDERIAELPLLSDAERQQLLVEWNATRTEFRSQESGVRSERSEDLSSDRWCIHELFAAQAVRTPDAVAVVLDGPPTTDHRPPIADRPSPVHPFTRSPLHPFICQHLTYNELNRRANQLAHHLRALGVGPEVRVGVCLERSPELMIALLGILKASGAYVPLDPAYPHERLAFMLEDSQAAVLITTNDQRPTTNDQRPTTSDQRPAITPSPLHPFTPSPLHRVSLSESWSAIALCADDDPGGALDPANLAYVIYTSGSTGQPKGSMIAHQALVDYALVAARRFSLRAGDRILQFASPSFDVMVEELYPTWLSGATVVLLPAGVPAPGAEFQRLVEDERLTGFELPTAYWQEWVYELARSGARPPDGLRFVIIGGENPLPERLDDWRPLRVPLFNAYGLTEVTVTSTAYETLLTAADQPERHSFPIGRPIANTQVYVLDRSMQPVPIGVPGELYIGGTGLGRGYQGRPDLTAERFIPNPFWGMGDKRSAGGGLGWGMEDSLPIPHPPSPIPRLYRTGDLVRYRQDGNLEFLGRADQQVKIRGYRVEPGEVAAALAQHPAVRECVVVAREDAPGTKRLVAYVVPTNDQRPTTNDERTNTPEASSVLSPQSSVLRVFLKARLPAYMIPSAFVTMEALPLTPNGKIDYRALPPPEADRLVPDDSFAAPRTPAEELLAQIWADVLRLEQVGVHGDFFALGGHSLLAARIVARVRETFQVELPLRSLFEAPTIAGLAEQIARLRHGAAQAGAPPLVPVARDRALPLSFVQQRLWFLEQLRPGSSLYNVPAAVRLIGPLDVAALRWSLAEIARRHEILRTTFAALDGQPAQVIAPARTIPLPLIDLRARGEDERESAARRLARAEARQPFDLSRGPLLRAHLLRLGDAEHVALLTMHHIVADAWSMEVLIREVCALYAARVAGQPASLPELPVQYADYAVWQREWLLGSGVGGQGSGARSQESGVRSQETRRQGDKETRRQGDWEAERLGAGRI